MKIFEVDWQAEDALEKYGYLFDRLEKRFLGQIDSFSMVEPKSVRWRFKAACLGIDTQAFFPERGDKETANAAKKVCEGCEVREECLIDALESEGSRHVGIRGGMRSRERKVVSRQWRIWLGMPAEEEVAA